MVKLITEVCYKKRENLADVINKKKRKEVKRNGEEVELGAY